MRVTSAAYKTALDRADTVSGQCAVYTRVLRQLGEIYAAKQRLEVDPEIEMPFTIEDAIEVYDRLAEAQNDGWQDLGFTRSRRLRARDARALGGDPGDHAQRGGLLPDAERLAAAPRGRPTAGTPRTSTRATSRCSRSTRRARARVAVPDSAYFAAHEAARGVGDAYLLYAAHPTTEEVDLAIRRYRSAIRLFPFDRDALVFDHHGAREAGSRERLPRAGAPGRRGRDALAGGEPLDRERRAGGKAARGAAARLLGQPRADVPRLRRGEGRGGARAERRAAARAEEDHGEQGGEPAPAARREGRARARLLRFRCRPAAWRRARRRRAGRGRARARRGQRAARAHSTSRSRRAPARSRSTRRRSTPTGSARSCAPAAITRCTSCCV